MDGGAEKIQDSDDLRRVRAQARRVRWQSLALATTLTAIFYLLPT